MSFEFRGYPDVWAHNQLTGSASEPPEMDNDLVSNHDADLEPVYPPEPSQSRSSPGPRRIDGGYRIMQSFPTTTESSSPGSSQNTFSRETTTPFASFSEPPESGQRGQRSQSENARKRTRPDEAETSSVVQSQDRPDARSHTTRVQRGEQQAPISLLSSPPEQSHRAMESSPQNRLPVQSHPEIDVVVTGPTEEGNERQDHHQRHREDPSPFKTALGRRQPTKTVVYQFCHHCPVSRRIFKRTKTWHDHCNRPPCHPPPRERRKDCNRVVP